MENFFNNHKKEILVGSISLFSFFLLSKIISKKSEEAEPILHKSYTKLSKQQILDYLRDFKTEILGPLFDIIALREDIKNVYKLNGEEINNDLLRKKIFKNFVSSIKNKELILMKRHTIKNDDLEGSIRDIFSNDEELAALKKEIDKSIENALNGISPALDLSNEVLIELNPVKCYEYTLEIMIKSLIKIRELYVQLKHEGVNDFSLGNPIVVMRSQGLNLKKLKEEVLMTKCFDRFKENPVELFTKAVHRHQDESKEFEMKIEGIENNYQKVMQVLSRDPEGLTNEGIEKIFNT